MSDLNQDVHDWLHQQPEWLQQAALMLLNQGSISEEGLQTITDLIKKEPCEASSSPRVFPGLGAFQQGQGELRLLDIGPIAGIENLNPRHPLAFGTGNLCVIYGHNGSGKSSYTRLLKKLCGKPRAKDLKPNVFHPPPEARHCTVRYEFDGAQQAALWQVSDPPIDDLRAVDLFDADEALTYLTSETTATYTPPAVALLVSLAAICDRVKSRLQVEQSALASVLPAMPAEFETTPTGVAYKGLKPSIPASTLQKITSWGDEDEAALAQLDERLKTRDPAALARDKRKSKSQIDHLTSHIAMLAHAFSGAQLTILRDLRTSAQTKRKQAIESAQVSSAKLDGIGNDTWRAMWNSAREYSQTAYPGKSFPVVDGEARCLLCHQTLDALAQKRLVDLEDFVQGKLESEANAAEHRYQSALKELPTPWTVEELSPRLQAAGLTDPSIAELIEALCSKAETIRTGILAGETNGPVAAIAAPAELLAALQEAGACLEADAKVCELDAMEFNREEAGRLKIDLEARRFSSQQSASINNEIARLKDVATFDKWKRMANSRAISDKAAAVAEIAITDAYVRRFNTELKMLGAGQIQVELVKTKTTKGRVLHKIRLKGAQTGHDVPDAVLSDGERRIISLAAFIADVVDKPYSAPFIFDDPISSLDHDFEWAVARRVAELAQYRQVLVFTHRLSLWGALDDAAKKLGDKWKKANFYQHCIEAFNGTSGHPAVQEAWAASTGKANNILLERLNDAKRAGESSGSAAYKALAQGICSDFRKLVERTIEDDLLNQVVRRHRRGVQTDNRLAALTQITDADCKYFDDLMTKYSCYEHSQSPETPMLIPNEPDLRKDLEDLKAWRDGFRKRRAA